MKMIYVKFWCFWKSFDNFKISNAIKNFNDAKMFVVCCFICARQSPDTHRPSTTRLL
jgi:hypothetical protein